MEKALRRPASTSWATSQGACCKVLHRAVCVSLAKVCFFMLFRGCANCPAGSTDSLIRLATIVHWSFAGLSVHSRRIETHMATEAFSHSCRSLQTITSPCLRSSESRLSSGSCLAKSPVSTIEAQSLNLEPRCPMADKGRGFAPKSAVE